jgi:hypothetical protein
VIQIFGLLLAVLILSPALAYPRPLLPDDGYRVHRIVRGCRHLNPGDHHRVLFPWSLDGHHRLRARRLSLVSAT